MKKGKNMIEYYSTDISETLKSLGTSGKGLTENEARQRLEKYGINEIEKRKRVTPLQIFVRQFTSFIVIILLAAIVISLLIGERLDATVIAVILILNGIFGFIQEYKAEKAIEALRRLTALKAKVIRDRKEMEIDSRELVPGDIILLETGSKVPADARLIEVVALQVDESSLTGESVPSTKVTEPLKHGTEVTDQENMVFMGTIVTKGRAKAVLINTGMNTEIGKIAEMIQDVKEKLTPLQEKLKQFGKWLGFLTIGICAVVFGVGVLREYLVKGVVESVFVSEMFLAAVALSVAAIPEGLPAIVTISLALGVRRMVKRSALLRQLPAVETLGCTNVICSDKTGTLTKNEMTVREIYIYNTLIKVTGEGYAPEGRFVLSEGRSSYKPETLETLNIKETPIFTRGNENANLSHSSQPIPLPCEYKEDPKALNHTEDPSQFSGFGGLMLLLSIGALCNDSRLFRNDKWEIFGDPTEGALLVSAGKAGLKKDGLEERFRRIGEIPFDSERKCMTTIHTVEGGYLACVKGAQDIILDRCKYIFVNGMAAGLTEEDRTRILKVNHDMADKALRVLGFAYKSLEEGSPTTPEEIEKDLTFVGLQAMIDPPREGVKEAIEKCKTAGIKTVLITGDHKSTAVAVARELGIFKEGDMALSGTEMDELSDEELSRAADDVVIYARVSPEHKVRILTSLKSKGHIVAMTGDGVNDAPALKKSDIGVAMGITGTDVAKEASDMVLTDDNFASIVNAVEEGRGIYNSIKQFIQYTLSSNLGEIVVIFMAILIGWPLPLIAIQILWVNLLTDGLPGLALGMDPFSKDIMKRPPRKREENIICKEVIQNILIVGTVMGIGTLFMFYSYGIETLKAKSIAFTTLIMFQLFNVLTYRAKNFRIDIKNSKYLIGSVIISLLMQIAVLYTPLNIAFKTVPIGLCDWIKIILVSFSLYIILESRKVLINHFAAKKQTF
ncbi:cation-translocating P-type ATPase [bacterium]|nr:cation-translocating P-type ATPase [bacterium]